MPWNTPRLLPALALLALCGCSSLRVGSQWRRDPIVVDGQDRDWVKVDAEKGFGLTLRAVNDADALYVCITADDADLKHQLCGGLPWTLRFIQPDGRQVGLSVGPRGYKAAQEGLTATVQPAVAGGPPVDHEARDAYWLGGGILPDVGPLDADRDGVEVADHQLYGTQVVELKIPLHPLKAGGPALDCPLGDSLAMRLELPPQVATPRRSGRGGGGRHGGGHHGGMGGGAPGGGMGGAPSVGEHEDAGEKPQDEPAPAAALLEGTLHLAKAP